MSTTHQRRNVWTLGLLAVGAAVGIAALPTITQDPAYHRFADARPLLGVPHAWNVLSNIPFLIVGLLGLASCLHRSDQPARAAWIVAFAGIAVVSLGSAWYHWSPSSAALVWDRVPMTVGFMGLFIAVLEPSIGAGASRRLLAPAVAVGLGSIAFWVWTGDLRPYIWVQFAPLLMIAAVVALEPGRREAGSLLAALLLYGAAKGLEAGDGAIAAASDGVVAGHALKHLAAAAACLLLVRVARVATAG